MDTIITTDLVKLQEKMDFLAGVKCSLRPTGSCSAAPKCPVCNGTGLDLRFEALRVRPCLSPELHLDNGTPFTNDRKNKLLEHENCRGYTTLSAKLAHQAVGKLLLISRVGLKPVSTERWLSVPGAGLGLITPEESLITALYDKEQPNAYA